MNIAIDCDGVIVNFLQKFYVLCNTIWPGRFEEGYQAQDWAHSDKLSEKEMAEAFRTVAGSENFWFSCQPLPGLAELQPYINIFRHRGIDVYYCTSRAPTKGDTVLVQTRNWLAQRGCLYSNCSVIPVLKHHLKLDVYRALDVRFSIDDRVETIEECRQLQQHQPYLLDQSWNRAAMNLPRVGSVREWCELVLHHKADGK